MTASATPERRGAPRRGAARSRFAAWAPLLVLVLLCAVITAINPNFLSFGNFVRITQASMIPLVLGLGATFIILMGSVDLSVEGVLTLGSVALSLLVNVFFARWLLRLAYRGREEPSSMFGKPILPQWQGEAALFRFDTRRTSRGPRPSRRTRTPSSAWPR